MNTHTSPASAGFLASLFDFSFSSFITTKLVRVIYVLAIAGNALFALVLVAGGFGRGFMSGVFALFVIAPLVFLLFTALARLWLEVMVVLFRTVEYARATAQNTDRMARTPGAV